MKILLIAGHGGGDPGATALGYQEAALTREVAALLSNDLRRYADVDVADTSIDMFTYLKTHTYNFRPYDYVLEIHFNAGANDPKGNGIVTGSEIYVTTSEPNITVEQDILAQLAKVGLTNRGVKRRNFSVISKIRAQGVSAALLEVAFIDDRDDMRLYQEKKGEIAEAIALGIAEGFGLVEKGDLTMTQYEELNAKIDSLTNIINVIGGEIQDLKEAVAALTPTIYNYIDENMPEWARPTIEKLVKDGYLKGDDNGKLELTTDMLRIFTVLDRAGLFNNN